MNSVELRRSLTSPNVYLLIFTTLSITQSVLSRFNYSRAGMASASVFSSPQWLCLCFVFTGKSECLSSLSFGPTGVAALTKIAFFQSPLSYEHSFHSPCTHQATVASLPVSASSPPPDVPADFSRRHH